jgi:hypothetical protein
MLALDSCYVLGIFRLGHCYDGCRYTTTINDGEGISEACFPSPSFVSRLIPCGQHFVDLLLQHHLITKLMNSDNSLRKIDCRNWRAGKPWSCPAPGTIVIGWCSATVPDLVGMCTKASLSAPTHSFQEASYILAHPCFSNTRDTYMYACICNVRLQAVSCLAHMANLLAHAQYCAFRRVSLTALAPAGK